jgi:hypothetical protein
MDMTTLLIRLLKTGGSIPLQAQKPYSFQMGY